jgi:Coenzyme PQQ synthesis protein D (PqqD)
MLALARPLPARRTDLLIKPLGDDGRYVVKDPRSGEFFQIGEAEHFLLMQLDGQKDAEAICATYAERFDETLSEEELDEFVKMAQAQGFLLIADNQLLIAESSERSSSNPQSEIRNLNRASSTGARVSSTPTGCSTGWRRGCGSSGRARFC